VRTRLLVLGPVLLVLVAAGVAYKVHHDDVAADRRSQRQAQDVVQRFARAMQDGDATIAAGAATPQSASLAGALVGRTPTDLHAMTTTVTLTSPVRRPQGASYTTKVQLRGLGPVQWSGQIPLSKTHAGWRVPFTESVLHPALGPGEHLARVRERGTRGKVLLADGSSMAADPTLSGLLRGQVLTLKAEEAAVKAGPGFEVGDDAGATGLQKAFQDKLAGRAGGAFDVVAHSGAVVKVLQSFPRVDGTDLTTTLDPKVEAAAVAAMASLGGRPGGLAAIDVASGAVLALADSPNGGYGRALLGTYPPGSTFKIVTSVAALSHGVTPGQTLDCAKTVSVGGRTFKNAEDEQFGVIAFARAFAKSCNTWFVQLTGKVKLSELDETARLFGFAKDQPGAAGPLPVPSFGGYYPTPSSIAGAAGQGIGQDQVLASPLQMASVAAAIGSGTWYSPHLTADAVVTAHPLPAAAVMAVRSFMAGVTTGEGTAARAGLPAGTIGKTGTAEHGSPDPKKTHAWFVAVRGGVAVAVVADDAGFGGEVAAPVVARFYRALG
jgi:hypothetical protein